MFVSYVKTYDANYLHYDWTNIDLKYYKFTEQNYTKYCNDLTDADKRAELEVGRV